MTNTHKIATSFIILLSMSSCLKEDECAEKTLCIINETGADQMVSISGDYFDKVNISDGDEKCLDLASDVENLEFKWGNEQSDFLLDQCYTDYTLQ